MSFFQLYHRWSVSETQLMQVCFHAGRLIIASHEVFWASQTGDCSAKHPLKHQHTDSCNCRLHVVTGYPNELRFHLNYFEFMFWPKKPSQCHLFQHSSHFPVNCHFLMSPGTFSDNWLSSSSRWVCSYPTRSTKGVTEMPSAELNMEK